MNKVKTVIFTLVAFVGGAIAGAISEGSYYQMIRGFMKFYKRESINFFGKGIFFPGTAFFCIAGVFFALLFLMIYRQPFRVIMSRLLMAMVTFLIATAITSYIDITIRLASYHSFESEVMMLNFKMINYYLHLLTSLGLSLIIVSISWYKARRRRTV